MAQIIKHRRGPIGNLKAATTNNGELLVASGSIGNLSGPFTFIGSPTPSDNGSTGAFRPVSKIYTGTSAPTISNLTYGTILDGTPFYATSNQSLYILNNDGTGNTRLDLTGNIENGTITNVQIDTLSGSVEILGDITGSNLQLSGNADITGNITLGGSIIIGDLPSDIIDFNGVISSSLVPSSSGDFDLGSSTRKWNFLYVNTVEATQISGSFSGSFSGDGSGITGVSADSIEFDNILNKPTLVSGSSQIDLGSASGNIALSTQTTGDYVQSLVAGNLIDLQNNTGEGATPTIDVDLTEAAEAAIADGDYILFLDGGATGTHAKENIADVATLFAGTGLTATNSVIAVDYGDTAGTAVQGNTTLTVQGTTNEIEVAGGAVTLGSGSTVTIGLPNDVTVTNNLTVGNDVFISGSLTLLGSATSVIISSSTVEIDDNILRLNAYSPFERYAGFEVIDSGSTGLSASLLWDSANDYWLIQSSSQETGKVISTTYSTFGSEVSLTSNTIPKATGESSIGDSLLTDNSTTLAYNTDAITVAASTGNTNIKGTVTVPNAGGSDAGSDSSNVVFRNSSNVLGYVPTTDTTAVMDQILGYRNSDGNLVFSSVIDGGTF